MKKVLIVLIVILLSTVIFKERFMLGSIALNLVIENLLLAAVLYITEKIEEYDLFKECIPLVGIYFVLIYLPVLALKGKFSYNAIADSISSFFYFRYYGISSMMIVLALFLLIKIVKTYGKDKSEICYLIAGSLLIGFCLDHSRAVSNFKEDNRYSLIKHIHIYKRYFAEAEYAVKIGDFDSAVVRLDDMQILGKHISGEGYNYPLPLDEIAVYLKDLLTQKQGRVYEKEYNVIVPYVHMSKDERINLYSEMIVRKDGTYIIEIPSKDQTKRQTQLHPLFEDTETAKADLEALSLSLVNAEEEISDKLGVEF